MAESAANNRIGGSAAADEEAIKRAMRESMKQQNPNAHIPGEDEINRAIRESESMEMQRKQSQQAQMTQEEQEIMAAIQASQAEADKQKN